MPAYLVARVEITDPKRYAEYTSVTPGVIQRYGGRFIVRGGQIVSLEGAPENRRLVIIEFPSMEHVKNFFESPEYIKVKALRAGAAIGQFLAVEGVPPTGADNS